MIKIPYSFLPPDVVKKLSYRFYGIAGIIEKVFPFLKVNLKQAEMKISLREYVSMCVVASIFFFIIFGLLLMFFLGAFGVKNELIGFVISLLFTFFIFLQQMIYPKLLVGRRIKGIERNLLAVMQNMLVQLLSLIHI